MYKSAYGTSSIWMTKLRNLCEDISMKTFSSQTSMPHLLDEKPRTVLRFQNFS